MAAFLLLIPLAITSFDIWKVRLGKNWKRLHQVVYLTRSHCRPALCHGRKRRRIPFLGNIGAPVNYGVVIALLLILRLPFIRKFFASLRSSNRFSAYEKDPHPKRMRNKEARLINFPTRKAIARMKRLPGIPPQGKCRAGRRVPVEVRHARANHICKIIIAHIHRPATDLYPCACRHEKRYQVPASTH